MYLCVLCLSCQLLFLKDVHLAAFSALCLWHKQGLESWSGKHSILQSFCLPCLMLLPGDKWTNLQFMSRCSVWISIQVFLAGKWQGQAECSTVIPRSFCSRFVRESRFETLIWYLLEGSLVECWKLPPNVNTYPPARNPRAFQVIFAKIAFECSSASDLPVALWKITK